MTRQTFLALFVLLFVGERLFLSQEKILSAAFLLKRPPTVYSSPSCIKNISTPLPRQQHRLDKHDQVLATVKKLKASRAEATFRLNVLNCNLLPHFSGNTSPAEQTQTYCASRAGLQLLTIAGCFSASKRFNQRTLDSVFCRIHTCLPLGFLQPAHSKSCHGMFSQHALVDACFWS